MAKHRNRIVGDTYVGGDQYNVAGDGSVGKIVNVSGQDSLSDAISGLIEAIDRLTQSAPQPQAVYDARSVLVEQEGSSTSDKPRLERALAALRTVGAATAGSTLSAPVLQGVDRVARLVGL